MGIGQARLWRYGAFNWMREALASEKKIVRCLVISENGVNSIVSIKLRTGYCVDEMAKRAWCVLQKLKLTMQGFSEPLLPISERSYMPLDPFGRLTEEERTLLQPLVEVADSRFNEEWFNIGDANKKSANAHMFTTVIWGFVIIIAIFGIIVVLKGC